MSAWVDWFRSANFAIYTCHFLASWSGRMWGFSMGVFLITIAPGSLQLSAIYGLTMGASVLVFGTVVGDWVDRTPRLKAALVSMILQNSFVICCACVVLVLFSLSSDVSDLDLDILKLFYGLIIGLSVLSRVMKVGRVIVIERDWIVEIAKSRKTPLAVMTSSFRRIDLLTKILAPIISGQILNFAGLRVGCVFIGAWSLVSVCVEYFLIQRVYKIVPALKEKDTYTWGDVPLRQETNDFEDHLPDARHELPDPSFKDGKNTRAGPNVEEHQPKSWSPLRLLASFIIIFQGFRTYISYDVKWAGFALASLYLTVIGFDGITVGYATTQGLSSSTLGILMGVGACFGICATFTYPLIVRRLGLPRTGVLALGMQVSCLSLCVLSVFLPGSPFDLFSNTTGDVAIGNCSNQVNSSSSDMSSTITPTTPGYPNTTGYAPCVPDQDSHSMVSVYVMMAGIVTARFGLWTADLTIIQLFLERVLTSERGVVNGFQSSLNQLMDFFKYALVAGVPFSHQFGLLIFISFSFICIGWSLMFVFAFKSRKTHKLSRETCQGHISRNMKS